MGDVQDASSYAGTSDEMVPTRAPSVRRVLLFAGGLAVPLAIWAAAEGTWTPLLVLASLLVLSGPFPWRRVFFETRGGYFVWWFVWGGVWFGVFTALADRGHPVASGLVFGVAIGGLQAIVWEKERRKRPRRLLRWLHSRSAGPSS